MIFLDELRRGVLRVDLRSSLGDPDTDSCVEGEERRRSGSLARGIH